MSGAYCIQMSELGGPDVLKKTQMEPREPGPGEVLVRQSAAGLNFIDTYFRSGLYPRELPFVVGSEVCGVIEADAEAPGDAEGAFEGGGVAALFDGDHGLPRHADLLGQGRLAHPVMGLAQCLHAVQDRGAFGHAYMPRR